MTSWVIISFSVRTHTWGLVMYIWIYPVLHFQKNLLNKNIINWLLFIWLFYNAASISAIKHHWMRYGTMFIDNESRSVWEGGVVVVVVSFKALSCPIQRKIKSNLDLNPVSPECKICINLLSITTWSDKSYTKIVKTRVVNRVSLNLIWRSFKKIPGHLTFHFDWIILFLERNVSEVEVGEARDTLLSFWQEVSPM
jgi:hypothetical protein